MVLTVSKWRVGLNATLGRDKKIGSLMDRASYFASIDGDHYTN